MLKIVAGIGHFAILTANDIDIVVYLAIQVSVHTIRKFYLRLDRLIAFFAQLDRNVIKYAIQQVK